MTKEEIEAKIKDLIQDQIQIEPKHIDVRFNLCEDLGMDSLDCVELTMAIEEEFDLEIMQKAADTLHTVQDVINYVSDHVVEV